MHRRSFDAAALRFLRTRCHAARVERGIRLFSRTGEHGAIWIALSAAGAVISPEQRPRFKRAGATVVASYLANQTIKVIVRRRRPNLPDLPPLVHTTANLSYPSAHATTSFAGARALCFALPPAALYPLAFALALSRPYLGVHYPSDSAAGAILGTAVAELLR